MPSLRRALWIAQPLFVVLAFVLMGLLLRTQWDSLRTYQWHVRLPWLLMSGAGLIGGWLIEIRLWQQLLGLLGGRLEYWSAVRIWFSSAIVRYVPGNVWQPISLTVRCREEGIRPEAAMASLTLFQVIHLTAIGPIAALYLATAGRSGSLAQWAGATSRWWAIAAAAPVVFFLVRPHSMLAVVNIVLTRMGREPLPLRLSTTQLLGMLGISLTAWAFFCSAFAMLAGAVLPPFGTSLGEALPHLLAAYPIAFAAGFFSLLTPSGLLVREGVLFLLLVPVVGKENAIVIALVMRAWEVILEGAMAGGAFGIPWLRRINASP